MSIEKLHNTDEKKLSLAFSNGAYKQLEELQKYYELDDISKVVELGINILELAKNKSILLEDDKGDLSKIKIHN